MANYSDLTSSVTWGWVLTIDACPYAFTTAMRGTSVAFTGLRPDDWPKSTVEPVIVPGGLVAPPGWSERIEPLKGRLNVDSITVQLRDMPDIYGGPAGAGVHILTWMTDRAASIASTPLDFATHSVTPVTSTTTSITVGDGSIFGAANFTIWIDREAIRISSRAANVLTVDTSAAVGRGVLGSTARAHRVVADASYAAEVYSSYPGPAFARCVLWVGVLNSSGNISDPIPVYRGRVQLGPRLKGGNDKSAGARWELPIDHVANVLDKVLLGSDGEACRTSGYIVDTEAGYRPIWALARAAAHSGLTATSITGNGWPAPTTQPYRYDSLSQYVAAMNSNLSATLIDGGLTGSTLEVAEIGDSALQCRGTATAPAGTLWFHIDWTLHVHGRADVTATYDVAAATGIAFLNAASIPASMQPVRSAFSAGASEAESSFLYVASCANLTQIAWASLNESGVPFGGESQGTIFASGDNYVLMLDAIQSGRISQTVVDAANRRVRGIVRAYDKHGARITTVPGVLEPYTGRRGYSASLLGEISFTQGIRVRHDSWVYGIKNGLVLDTVYSGTVHEFDVDSRDWDWTYAMDTSVDTPEVLRRRDWTFTGEQSLKDIVEECCQFAGAAPSLRRSQISIRSIRVPLRSDAAAVDTAHTLSYNAGTIYNKAGWQQNRDGIANVGVFKIGDDNERSTTVQVNAQRSRARYGQQQTLEVKVRGISVTAELLGQGSRSIQAFFTRRIEGLWAEPTATITISVPLYLLDSVYLLDVVSVSHWLPPNTQGTRGISGASGLVVGRRPDPSTARIELDIMRWPHFANVSGFSPCVRVTAIAGAVCTVGTSYANSSDYAGSNQTGYQNSTRGTVANDGGAGYFIANDRVELVERKNTAPRAAESFVVQSVNTGTPSITLTGAPPAAWQTIISGGGYVDLRYDAYSTASLQTAQKAWAWIAARATRVIDGTADPRFRWAP